MPATETDFLILVDEHDREIGRAEKLVAHQQNLLHRAFSVFIFCDDQLLLQQRGLDKYHSPGLWTNTCCSHPYPNEDVTAAGERRLREELGLEVGLRRVGSFLYNAYFENGLSEHEIDHVLVGRVAREIELAPNPDEIHAVRWVGMRELEGELERHPERFTPWFGRALALALSSS